MRSIPTRSCYSWAVAISHLCFADHCRSIADSMTCTAVARLQTIADRGPLNGFMTFCDVRDVANIDIRLASGRRGRFFFWGGHFLAVSGRLRCRRPHGSRPRRQRRENSAPINDRRATGRREREHILIAFQGRSFGWAGRPSRPTSAPRQLTHRGARGAARPQHGRNFIADIYLSWSTAAHGQVSAGDVAAALRHVDDDDVRSTAAAAAAAPSVLIFALVFERRR